MEGIIGFVLGFLVDFIRSIFAPATTEYVSRLVPSMRRKSNVQQNMLVLEMMKRLKELGKDPELAFSATDDAKNFQKLIEGQREAFVESEVEIIASTHMNQLEMNEEASRRSNVASSQLEQSMRALQASGTLDELQIEELAKSQDAWEVFAEAHASFVAGYFRGGSMAPIIFHGEIERLAILRSAQVRSIQDEFRDL